MTTTSAARKTKEPAFNDYLGMSLTDDELKAVKRGHMIPMKSLRTITISNTSGHAKRIEANEPTLMPRALVKDAMEKGCVPVQPEDTTFVDNLERTKHDFGPGLRKAVIFIAMDEILKENDTSKFNGAGQPRIEVISDMVGFDVAKKEMQSHWQELNSLRKSDGELPSHPNANLVYAVVNAEDRKELERLAEDEGIDAEKVKGLITKDLRYMLIKKFSNE